MRASFDNNSVTNTPVGPQQIQLIPIQLEHAIPYSQPSIFATANPVGHLVANTSYYHANLQAYQICTIKRPPEIVGHIDVPHVPPYDSTM